MYYCLSEGGPLVSKHVEDVKNQKLKYKFRTFVFCWLMLDNFITLYGAESIKFTCMFIFCSMFIPESLK
jgi:hypothetical protein